MKILGWRRQSEEDRVAQAAHEQQERAKIRDLVTRPGFKPLIEDWITTQAAKYRILPAEEKTMFYQIGFRDGLESVVAHIEALKVAGRQQDE